MTILQMRKLRLNMVKSLFKVTKLVSGKAFGPRSFVSRPSAPSLRLHCPHPLFLRDMPTAPVLYWGGPMISANIVLAYSWGWTKSYPKDRMKFIPESFQRWLGIQSSLTNLLSSQNKTGLKLPSLLKYKSPKRDAHIKGALISGWCNTIILV